MNNTNTNTNNTHTHTHTHTNQNTHTITNTNNNTIISTSGDNASKTIHINTKLFQPSVWDDFPMKRNNQVNNLIVQSDFELDLPEKIKLPKGFQFIDLKVSEHLERITSFLNEHYVDSGVVYTQEYIDFLFKSPRKHFRKLKSCSIDYWLIGIEEISTGILYGFIGARPLQYFIDGRLVDGMIVDCMCVAKSLRGKRMSVVLMKEMYKRLKHIENDCMTLFCTSTDLPFQPLTAFSKLLYRDIISNKIMSESEKELLNDLIKKRDNEQDVTLIKQLNNQIAELQNDSSNINCTQDIHQIRLANKRDIDDLMKIYNNYNKKYRFFRIYNKKEFEHFFMPRKDMVYTYLLTNSQGEVKDFITLHVFYSNQGSKIAYVYYVSFINDKLLELFMKNIMYILKENDVERVLCYEWLGVSSVLSDKLQFKPLGVSKAFYAFNYNTKSIGSNECNIGYFL